MSVRKLDKNGDWTFGQGLGNYIKNDDEIVQNVTTRVKSFKNDYFLDTEQYIDWLNDLAFKGNEDLIISNIRRVVAETNGILRVNDVSLLNNTNRNATININFDTINNKNLVLSSLNIFSGGSSTPDEIDYELVSINGEPIVIAGEAVVVYN